MLLVAPEDQDVAERFSEWLRRDAPRRSKYDGNVQPVGVGYLNRITEPNENHWGGWKNPECDVWAGALNHANLDAVLTEVRTLPWRFPGALQLFVMDQEETYFRLHMFCSGELRQYAREPQADADEQHAW